MLRRLDIFPDRTDPKSEAVYIWGAEYEPCAAAMEMAGLPVLRLDSGGICAAWSESSAELLQAGRFRVSYERLSWRVVEWRELGRALFKDTIIDLLEEEHSVEPGWGGQDYESVWARAIDTVVQETRRRLKLADRDDVLVMCVWRLFDRERALLAARYGLGGEEDQTVRVLEGMGLDSAARERLQQLHGAALAWW